MRVDQAQTPVDQRSGRAHEPHHQESRDQRRTHRADFMAAYNLARWLTPLSGLTPTGYIANTSTSEPDRFIGNPVHQLPGLNIGPLAMGQWQIA